MPDGDKPWGSKGEGEVNKNIQADMENCSWLANFYWRHGDASPLIVFSALDGNGPKMGHLPQKHEKKQVKTLIGED